MVFRNSIEPAFCVTFEADITKFKNKVKEEGLSFTLAMVYAVCKCANEVDVGLSMKCDNVRKRKESLFR